MTVSDVQSVAEPGKDETVVFLPECHWDHLISPEMAGQDVRISLSLGRKDVTPMLKLCEESSAKVLYKAYCSILHICQAALNDQARESWQLQVIL